MFLPQLYFVQLHGNDASRKAIKRYELYEDAEEGAGASARTRTRLQVTKTYERQKKASEQHDKLNLYCSVGAF